MPKHQATIQQAVDYTIGGAGASSPVWFPWLNAFNEILATVAGIGGVFLVVIRLRIALREWRMEKCKTED